MKQALLITGGTVDDNYLRLIYDQLEEDCFVLGVDGGCQTCVDADVPLDAIIGDFDTLDQKTKKNITDSGIKTMTLNRVKNVTDTHAALDYLFIHEFTKVIVLGGRGTRLDHTLSNLMVSFSYFPKMNVEFNDIHNCIRPFVGPAIIKGKRQDNYKYLSIIPIEETMVKASEGLKYGIHHQKFKPFDSFGVSNEINHDNPDESFTLEVESGKFFIIESID